MFEVWLRARLPSVSAKFNTTKAINNALNQWQACLQYCEHGIAEIDPMLQYAPCEVFDRRIANNTLARRAWNGWGRKSMQSRRC